MPRDASTGPWLARRFVICALALGLLYAFINPPLAVNDERHHLIYAYELSLGETRAHVDESGTYFEAPAPFSSLVQRYASVQNAPKERVDLDQLWTDFSARESMQETARFRTRIADQFPAVYLPQVAGISLARALGLPIVWYVYLARLATLAASALLLGWAVSIAGRQGWVFAALGLMPMTLTQISGVSPDASIIALSFVLFAMLAQCSSPEEPFPTRTQRAALACVFALLVLCKPSCVLFALALPAVRWSDADGRRTRLAFAIITVLLSSALTFAWNHARWSYLEATLISPALDQAQWIFAHPLGTLKAWGRALFRDIDDYVIQFVAMRDIVSRQVRFSTGVVATLYIQLLLVLTIGTLRLPTEARAQRRQVARWLSATAAAYTIVVFAMVHLTANEEGTSYVHGMQGRFLIPVAPAVFGAMATLGSPIATRWLLYKKGLRTMTIIVCLNGFCLCALIGRYYAPFESSWPY